MSEWIPNTAFIILNSCRMTSSKTEHVLPKGSYKLQEIFAIALEGKLLTIMS